MSTIQANGKEIRTLQRVNDQLADGLLGKSKPCNIIKANVWAGLHNLRLNPSSKGWVYAKHADAAAVPITIVTISVAKRLVLLGLPVLLIVAVFMVLRESCCCCCCCCSGLWW